MSGELALKKRNLEQVIDYWFKRVEKIPDSAERMSCYRILTSIELKVREMWREFLIAANTESYLTINRNEIAIWNWFKKWKSGLPLKEKVDSKVVWSHLVEEKKKKLERLFPKRKVDENVGFYACYPEETRMKEKEVKEMTRYDKKQRDELRDAVKNKRIIDLEYDDEDDYYTIVMEDNSEFSLRFMADLV